MALYLWLEGRADYEPHRLTEDLPDVVGVKGDAYRLRKGDIPGYFTAYFWAWFDAWWWYHDAKMLPLEKSWFHHPRHVTETIQMMESVYNRFHNAKLEAPRANH